MTKLVPLLGFPRPRATTGFELLEIRYLPFLKQRDVVQPIPNTSDVKYNWWNFENYDEVWNTCKGRRLYHLELQLLKVRIHNFNPTESKNIH